MIKQKARPLVPLNRIRLHEEIIEQVKDQIIRGDLKPGSKLPPERELAEQLQVNRTTVREALHKLESMGLIDIRHGNGIYIRDYRESGSLELVRQILFLDGRVNLGMIKNLMDLRMLLVPEMSYHAALNRSPEDLQELERVVFHSADMPNEEKDWRVHNIIARASGNLLFVILLNSFTNLTKDYFALYFKSEKNRKRSTTFHKEIYGAIKKKDAAAAKKIMQDVLIFAEKQTFSAIDAALGNRPGQLSREGQL